MAADDIKITINGEAKKFDVMPQIIDGRTLVPMRAIFENLGASVGWYDETQTAFAMKDDVSIVLQIGNTIMAKSITNGESETIVLDVPAQLINSRTLVPIRAVSEAFDCNVDWIEETQSVIITTK
jgi:hypothetical protein